jgi:hypothetical protein
MPSSVCTRPAYDTHLPAKFQKLHGKIYTDFGLMIADCGTFEVKIIRGLREAIDSNYNTEPRRITGRKALNADERGFSRFFCFMRVNLPNPRHARSKIRRKIFAFLHGINL